MDKFVAASDDKVTKMMMTEAYASISEQVKWYGQTDEITNVTTLGSHMPFNFALITALNVTSKAVTFSEAIDSWINAMPTYGKANWVLGNHDRSRVGFRYGEDRHESLAILTMMLPGLNVVYYVSSEYFKTFLRF